jgi:hypothetical protein
LSAKRVCRKQNRLVAISTGPGPVGAVRRSHQRDETTQRPATLPVNTNSGLPRPATTDLKASRSSSSAPTVVKSVLPQTASARIIKTPAAPASVAPGQTEVKTRRPGR